MNNMYLAKDTNRCIPIAVNGNCTIGDIKSYNDLVFVRLLTYNQLKTDVIYNNKSGESVTGHITTILGEFDKYNQYQNLFSGEYSIGTSMYNRTEFKESFKLNHIIYYTDTDFERHTYIIDLTTGETKEFPDNHNYVNPTINDDLYIVYEEKYTGIYDISKQELILSANNISTIYRKYKENYTIDKTEPIQYQVLVTRKTDTRDNEYNLFDLRTKKLVFDEWVSYIQTYEVHHSISIRKKDGTSFTYPLHKLHFDM